MTTPVPDPDPNLEANQDDADDAVVPVPTWLREMYDGSGLFGATTAADPTATDAIRHDRFDEATWAETRANVPSLDESIRERGKEEDYVDDLYQDFYNLTVKGDPELREAGEMVASHQPNQAMIEHFTKYKEHQELRQYTVGDQYAAAMGMLSMSSELDAAYERMAAARAAAEAAEQLAEQAAAAAAELADALNAAMADPASADPAALAALQAAQQGTAGQAAAGQAAASQAAAQAASGAANGLRKAAAAAADERAAEESLMSAFGIDPGQLQRMDFKERYALAKRLRSNRLAKFTGLIGQFRAFAAAERRRLVKHVPDEVVGVKLGDDLLRLTAPELMNLATEEVQDDFWRRYSQGQLLVNETAGRVKVGRGPIIFVCDESGSMASADLGGATREAWSKALALALADQARHGHRDFVYIGFSSPREQFVCAMPEGKAPISTVIEFTEHFFNGGTHYDRPLNMALELVEDYGRRDKPKPDVVFVTDDDYGSLDPAFLSRWNAAKEKLQMTCYGVGIGINPHRSGALAAISDDVREVSRMAHDVTLAADIFRAL